MTSMKTFPPLRTAAAAALLAWAAATPVLALPVSGRVLGPGGVPVDGARAELIPDVGEGGLREPPAPAAAVAAADVGRDGRFTLDAPGPGLWRVVVRAPGYVPVEARLHPLLGEARLPPAILPLDAGQRVAVADREGRPVVGALVEMVEVAEAAAPPGSRRSVWAPVERAARSGADGIAVLPRAEGETLEVRARSERHDLSAPVRAHGRLVLVRLDSPRVPPPAEQPATTRWLRGRIVDAETGLPIAGALAWTGAGPAATAAPDGSFELAASGTGPLRLLHVAAPGYLAAEVDPGTGRALPEPLRLRPAAAVEGVVVDTRGRPVADAEVHLEPASAGRLPAASAVDGRFRLGELPPGTALSLAARLEHPGGPGPAAAPLPLSPLAPREEHHGLRLSLARGATVSGTVAAGTGRDAAEVAGARVRLEPLRAGAGPTVEVTTGLDGRFALADLPAGRYRLAVRAVGFPTPDLPPVVVPERLGRLGDVDLGRVVLPRAVDLAGLVTEPDGRPIAGVEVRVAFGLLWGARPAASEHADTPPARAITAEDGSFRLAGLPEGARLDLSATHPDYRPAALADVEVVEAVAGSEVSIVMMPGVRASGRVLDEAGEGIATAAVTAWVVSLPGIRVDEGVGKGVGEAAGEAPAAPATAGQQATAAEDGSFELRGLPPGALRLRASAPGHQAAELSGLDLGADQPLEGIELVLAPAAVLEGTVRTPEGAPLPRARIGVRPAPMPPAPDGVAAPPAAVDHPVDGEGRFRIDGLAPGAVVVAADHDRYREVERSLDLRPGINRVDLVLKPGLAVAGRVVDGAGAPVAGATVGLTGAGVHRVDRVDRVDRAWARSREDGSFRLAGLAAGRHAIEARKGGYSPAVLTVELAEAPLEGIELRLERGATLAGRLLGLTAGELARVEVAAVSPQLGVRDGVVEPGGHYRIDGLEPGDWMATASVPPGSRHARAPVRVAGTGTVAADLDFGQGLALAARVLVNGAPLSGVRIEALGTEGQGAGAALTDERGMVRISGLAPGPYRLELAHPASGLTDQRQVELPLEDTLEDLADRRLGRRPDRGRCRPGCRRGRVAPAARGRQRAGRGAERRRRLLPLPDRRRGRVPGRGAGGGSAAGPTEGHGPPRRGAEPHLEPRRAVRLRRRRRALLQDFRWALTSFVSSNMLTASLPPKMGLSVSSAMIRRLS